MTGLLIGPEERAKIAELWAFAEANPLEPLRVIELAADNMDKVRDVFDMYSIELPVGFHVTYSQEHQPCGLCHHLSVSIDRTDKMPHPESVEMILREFEMQPIAESINLWIEYVDDETKAVNIVQLVRPT
jgi:hypothetical protein